MLSRGQKHTVTGVSLNLMWTWRSVFPFLQHAYWCTYQDSLPFPKNLFFFRWNISSLSSRRACHRLQLPCESCERDTAWQLLKWSIKDNRFLGAGNGFTSAVMHAALYMGQTLGGCHTQTQKYPNIVVYVFTLPKKTRAVTQFWPLSSLRKEIKSFGRAKWCFQSVLLVQGVCAQDSWIWR